MHSYIFTTHGLRELVQHTSAPASAKSIKKIEIASRRLPEYFLKPELNDTLSMASEHSLLIRREEFHQIWEADRRALSGIGASSAANSFAILFANLAAADQRVTVSVTGTRARRPHGATALFNQIDAYLDNDDCESDSCDKVIVALLAASRLTDAPIKSLTFELQIGYFSLGPDFVALQQGFATHGHPQLGTLSSLAVGFAGIFSRSPRDKWALLDMIMTAAPAIQSLTLQWNDARMIKENYALMLHEISALTRISAIRDLTLINIQVDHTNILRNLTTPPNTLRSLSLTAVYLTQDDLIRYLGTQHDSLRELKLDTTLMQGNTYWRATLRWIADNLQLEKLELRGLTCMGWCESLEEYHPQVMCGRGDEGWWLSHGVYQGTDVVKEGLITLVEHGKYQWEDSPRDCKMQEDLPSTASP
ncbi:hypothetical protein LTR17_007438 [Elasticomyces elasticus]|nr:hypothetical protein LTR17_007438 [Elasticomyces elasticus]